MAIASLRKYINVYLFILFLLVRAVNAEHGDNHYFLYTDGEANERVLDLEEKRVVLFFVFGELCTTCNKNVPMWNRIARLCDPFNDSVLGVSFAHSGLGMADSGMRFPVVCPVVLSEFKKAYDLREGVDYTLVLHRGRLIHSALGLLNADDYTQIRDRLNILAAQGEE